MDAFVIQGGKRLRGRIRINGSKNATLPLMATSLLSDAPLELCDVPDLADVRNMARLLGELGCQVERGAQQSLTISAVDPEPTLAHYDIVRTMRASICVL